MGGAPNAIDWASLGGLWLLLALVWLDLRRREPTRLGDEGFRPPVTSRPLTLTFGRDGERREWVMRSVAIAGLIPFGVAWVIGAPGAVKLWWWLIGPAGATILWMVGATLLALGWFWRTAPPAAGERAPALLITVLLAVALATVPIVVVTLGPERRWAVAVSLATTYGIFRGVLVLTRRWSSDT